MEYKINKTSSDKTFTLTKDGVAKNLPAMFKASNDGNSVTIKMDGGISESFNLDNDTLFVEDVQQAVAADAVIGLNDIVGVGFNKGGGGGGSTGGKSIIVDSYTFDAQKADVVTIDMTGNEPADMMLNLNPSNLNGETLILCVPGTKVYKINFPQNWILTNGYQQFLSLMPGQHLTLRINKIDDNICTIEQFPGIVTSYIPVSVVLTFTAPNKFNAVIDLEQPPLDTWSLQLSVSDAPSGGGSGVGWQNLPAGITHYEGLNTYGYFSGSNPFINDAYISTNNQTFVITSLILNK